LPKDLKKALLHATFLELKNLIEKGTFSLQDAPQLGEQVLPTKITCKAKQTASGGLNKLKGQIIARGNLQQGPYELDTWSPCTNARGIKLILAFCAKLHRPIKNGDFVGAYLQVKQVSRTFVSLDKNYVPYILKYSEHFGRALHVVKGIYGLMISRKLWSIEFSQ
jgi:hypothetical protein